MKRDLISILDMEKDIEDVISLALKVKRDRYSKRTELDGRTVGMIFEKPSTRTRISL